MTPWALAIENLRAAIPPGTRYLPGISNHHRMAPTETDIERRDRLVAHLKAKGRRVGTMDLICALDIDKAQLRRAADASVHVRVIPCGNGNMFEWVP